MHKSVEMCHSLKQSPIALPKYYFKMLWKTVFNEFSRMCLKSQFNMLKISMHKPFL